ncbi:hypothetical protein PV08_01186 [Exophiala spinifera]|uniref:Uncharacterized protein n=1 Tax=Exophiala spinifera TaxID=91928 RepID=A0A0D1YZ99_9EURO|nr:uncharacterized protein PV08_01186 [Exophiala spinifera]KIW20611.1 hypothetical protein PV08_01186 [Exophiala spinifera]
MPPTHSQKHAVASEKSFYTPGLVAASDGNARPAHVPPQQYDSSPPPTHAQAQAQAQAQALVQPPPYPQNIPPQHQNNHHLQPHDLAAQLPAAHVLAPSSVAFGPHGPGVGPGPGAEARRGDHNPANAMEPMASLWWHARTTHAVHARRHRWPILPPTNAAHQPF